MSDKMLQEKDRVQNCICTYYDYAFVKHLHEKNLEGE